MCTEIRFFDKMRLLADTLALRGNTPAGLGLVGGLLSDADVRREFFKKLDAVEWVKPLKDAGYFAVPPKAEKTDDGATRFPRWPESNYLARMATKAEGEVAEQIADIFARIDTDNGLIIGDMVEAATALPPHVAVRLVPSIVKVMRADSHWVYDDASDFCVKLAEGGEAVAAMELAVAIFTPKVNTDEEKKIDREEYWYKEGLKKVAPVLGDRQPMKFLPILCGWLDKLVRAEKGTNRKTGADFSYIWRPAVEDHAQNLDYKPAAVMVGFLRDGFEQAIRKGKFPLTEAIRMLDFHRYRIFGRIRLHLINEFAEQNRDLARKVMMDPKFFDDYQYKHEYAMLVRRRLSLLTKKERNTWFGWVAKGRSFKGGYGRDATAKERRDEKRYWQFQKLHCVRNHLQGKWKKFYQSMLAENGEPQLADLNSWSGDTERGFGGSPYTIDELSGMTFQRAVEKVNGWAADKDDGFMRTTFEGLAGTFRQYVAGDPVTLSKQAATLKGKRSIYVRHFIGAMADAVKSGKEIDLLAVLDLCQWVISQPVDECTTPQTERPSLVDPDWQWTRGQISDFVRAIVEARIGGKSDGAPRYPLKGLQKTLWGVVSVLCRDSSKSNILRDTKKDDPRAYDYLDLAINSPRGQAVGAALEYARWVANHKKCQEGNQEIVPGGFDAMPEVREMLDWQIADGNRSVEALAVIGSKIGLIYWIGKDWVASNAERIFHLEGFEETPPSIDGWAAWNAFMVWGSAHIAFYKTFRLQYAYAVSQATKVKPGKEDRDPMNGLGKHLMLLYARRQLGFDKDECLLRRFIVEAKPEIRRHAIRFVGQILVDNKELPPEVVRRFRTLWKVYWNGPGRRDAKDAPTDWLFGPWFSSGKFPVPWSLEQLEQFVEMTPTPEPDDPIAKKLAEFATPRNIARVVRILDRMVKGDRDGWRVHGWKEHAKTILKVAMSSKGRTLATAIELINYLGRRGHREFGELLGQ